MAAGTIVLFGSGETAASGRRVYDWLFSRIEPPVRVAILETPAGFQPNSQAVAQKVADFLGEHLQNHRPETMVVPARARTGPFSTDDPDLLSHLLSVNVIFMGAGSPTYAVRNLEGSRAFHYLQAMHRMGASVVLASAASTAVGEWCLPVYEIYKVGEPLHWHRGLDIFGAFGLHLAVVPHWDNSEGGAELDTSRCFMGRARFTQLLEMLPPACAVMGIEEHSAVAVDLASQECRVMGRGGVELLREGNSRRFESGSVFALSELGEVTQAEPAAMIPAETWEDIQRGIKATRQAEVVPAEVMDLVGAREIARGRGEWADADRLRQRIAELGWRVVDAPEGPQVARIG